MYNELVGVHLVVEIATDLGELAVPLDDVLDGGALHHEGVLAVRVDHLLDALVVGRDHHLGSVNA